MKLKHRIKNTLYRWDNALSFKLRNVSFPGFKGKSIYEVGKFLSKSLFFDKDQNLRASALAFNFFLAIFPAIIFLFTLVAYIPIKDMHGQILQFIEAFLPPNAFELVLETITDILNNQNAGLLSFGFIAALYFSSNGFANMISAFDEEEDKKFKRNWFDIRLKSFGLSFLVVSILVSVITVSLTVNYTLGYLGQISWVENHWIEWGLIALNYFLTIMLVYLIFSSLYYFGSSKTAKWKFFSAGSTVATVLSILTTYGFTLYVENFNSYNKLYGSIGTILVLMILIYFNCFVVLIGFELNKSIDKVE